VDFSFTEEQDAVRDLAKHILEDQVTHERLKEVAAGTERFDRRTWEALAGANLLGLSLPESCGGSGLGFLETCLVLEQVGRTVAFVPVLPCIVMGAMAIARFGSAAQQQRALAGVASGQSLLTAALVEPGAPVARPTTFARKRGTGWALEGVKLCVPFGAVADRILVPARTASGAVGVFIVDATARGLEQESLETTSGLPETKIILDRVKVGPEELLGDLDPEGAVLRWIVEHTTVGLCILTVGVCEQALRLTADYTKTREQFDKPIASFQAVGQRAADAYIDTEAVRLTAWQAAWRLSAGLPAAEQVAIAKFWAADGGQRVVHAAQHLHGGMGVDRDYPLHRYFLWAKQLELTLGGATSQLLQLGALLAS
jgi:alkylation response protein AidB-like acyl-CoA dehydrogenase